MQLHHQLLEIFQIKDIVCEVDWFEPGIEVKIITQSDLMFFGLECVQFFYQFCYTPIPQAEDVTELRWCRNGLLAMLNHFNASLTPTSFYMLNTLFAVLDEYDSLFPFLNEGVERWNQIKKIDARRTFKKIREWATGVSRWTRILQMEHLKKVLELAEFMPEEYVIPEGRLLIKPPKKLV